MSEQTKQPITIIKDGNTIIIAQPPVRQQKSIVDTFSGFFKSDPVSAEIQKEGVRAFGDDTYIAPVEGQKSTWMNLFNCQNRAQCRKMLEDKVSQWKDADDRIAKAITKFKQQNLLNLGDIRLRSVLMAFSSALLYKCISYNTTGFLRKSRNLGVSFVFMGYWFVPQLFNPFLRRPNLVHKVV